MLLIEKLFDGKLDIVGDVHGEIESLENLLEHLGYAGDGSHPDGRRLVFVGDLVDRGPDSPAVVKRVKSLVDAGRAQCILGNHELNIMLDKEKRGNEWFMKTDDCPANMKVATATEQKEFLEFFSELPIALKNASLRVVHACWNDKLAADGSLALHEAEKAVFGARIAYGDNAPSQHWPQPEMLPGHGKFEEARQMGNPVCILTSGVERETTKPFTANGKFRFADRIRWWDEYLDDTPVVVGHYWRSFKDMRDTLAGDTGPDLFEDIDPYSWMGRKNNVYCVDFSVGAKAIARLNKTSSEGCGLAALRWPEEEVVFDDGNRRKLVRSNNKHWSQDVYIKAWNFAPEFHEGQKVPGKHYGYMNHIGLVAMEVMSCIAQDDSFEKPDLAVQCAILHDVIRISN